MPRIQDIGAFNAVREAGLAKLMPPVPRDYDRHGNLRPRQRRRRRVSRLCRIIERSGMDVVLASVGCFGACFQEPLVNVRLPGQPLVVLQRVQANDAGAHPARPVYGGNITPDLIYCKIEEWDHVTGIQVWARVSRNSARGTKCRSSKARRRSFCAIADSSILTTLKNTSAWADTRRSTRC